MTNDHQAPDGLAWFTGMPFRLTPDCPNSQHYTVIIRAPEDPDRKPRPKGGQKDRAPHLTLAKTKPHEWHDRIRDLMADGKMRTLNAIGVELIDKTADIIAWSPVSYAVFDLVGAWELEITNEAPIRFRRRDVTP